MHHLYGKCGQSLRLNLLMLNIKMGVGCWRTTWWRDLLPNFKRNHRQHGILDIAYIRCPHVRVFPTYRRITIKAKSHLALSYWHLKERWQQLKGVEWRLQRLPLPRLLNQGNIPYNTRGLLHMHFVKFKTSVLYAPSFLTDCSPHAFPRQQFCSNGH